jgi:hypothetical protein
MSFTNYMNTWARQGLPYIEEIGLKKAIRLKITDAALAYEWSVSKLSPVTAEMLAKMGDQTSNTLEMFLLGEVVANGPKVFEVDQLDMEMLIHTDVNIQMLDYVQPFETVIIQLPEDFRRNRRIELLQGGNLLHGHQLPEKTEPDFCILHHNKDLYTIVFALVFDTGISIKTGFTLSSDRIIEDTLKMPRGKAFNDSMDTSEGENILVEELMRACLNYCLLVDEVGVKRVGYGNESYANRLQKRIRRNVNRQANQRELRLLPVKYTLNQEVKLYRTVSSPGDLPAESGQRVSPHHRRGHYRMQPHGPQSSLRKRIRIPPVFVNATLFLGSMKEAKVTYK